MGPLIAVHMFVYGRRVQAAQSCPCFPATQDRGSAGLRNLVLCRVGIPSQQGWVPQALRVPTLLSLLIQMHSKDFWGHVCVKGEGQGFMLIQGTSARAETGSISASGEGRFLWDFSPSHLQMCAGKIFCRDFSAPHCGRGNTSASEGFPLLADALQVRAHQLSNVCRHPRSMISCAVTYCSTVDLTPQMTSSVSLFYSRFLLPWLALKFKKRALHQESICSVPLLYTEFLCFCGCIFRSWCQYLGFCSGVLFCPTSAPSAEKLEKNDLIKDAVITLFSPCKNYSGADHLYQYMNSWLCMEALLLCPFSRKNMRQDTVKDHQNAEGYR